MLAEGLERVVKKQCRLARAGRQLNKVLVRFML